MTYLTINNERARLMRYDTAVILKRFYFCERSLLISEAGWIAATAPLLLKTEYAKMMWQDAQAADAMRNRVFELRYPSRLVSQEGEEPLIQFLEEARNAPSALAFYVSLVDVFKPALADAYRQYLDLADAIGDGPSIRFMTQALRDKEQQIDMLASYQDEMLAADPGGEAEARAWVDQLQIHLDELGGIGLEKVEAPASDEALELESRVPFAVAQVPARESAYPRVRFYWPDVISPDYPYGEGLSLQMRSAVSHINEVWAIEACSAFTYAFANVLPWEFLVDATRWTYDESRHCRMGYERLMNWGFSKDEIPLGTYIYDAAKDEDPIYRLGMLYFFETKNINKKPKRRDKFIEYDDALSQHDMDFDWADETIHAHYGNLWLQELQKARGEEPDPKAVRARCHELIDAIVASASDEERDEIVTMANAMLAKAEAIARGSEATPA
jgi:hypothetical protein